jgi:hypothetical protein
MTENMRALGMVKLVQIQPSGLIVQTEAGEIYDPSRRVEVDSLLVTQLGIEADINGERVIDIHHIDHPDKAYDNKDLVSIGFTSHYEAMRKRFGEHMVNGAAGENIIIEYEHEIWMEDLGEKLIFENVKTGKRSLFDVIRFAAPCNEFSHFVADSQHERLPADELKSTLQFLNNGRRGFLLVLSDGQDSATVESGDKIWSFAVNKV